MVLSIDSISTALEFALSNTLANEDVWFLNFFYINFWIIIKKCDQQIQKSQFESFEGEEGADIERIRLPRYSRSILFQLEFALSDTLANEDVWFPNFFYINFRIIIKKCDQQIQKSQFESFEGGEGADIERHGMRHRIRLPR